MVNLEKLETAIDELEASSKHILRIEEIVKEIDNLSQQTSSTYEVLNSLINSINDLNEKSLHTNELSEKALTAIENHFTKSKEANEKFVSQVNTQLLEMRNESTSLQKNFESTITSKFELFKSDLVVENRNIVDHTVTQIGTAMQRQKEDLIKSSLENTDTIISKIEEIIDKKSRTITILLICAIVISVINVVLLFII